jgi:UDP-N-acetylglucosamine--N-acetylmuramyl-(pentapeptide) pyrophosphoryl-undecaprenol N-acetylglucosamine transferase
LVFGGSQGAKALNSAAIEGLPDLLKQRPHMTVTHQTGEADHDRVSQAYRRAGVTATVLPFVYDMPAVPTAIYDHQMKNAQVMEAAGAAVVLPQADLTGATLARSVAQILDDPQRMKAMEDASVGLRRLDAAEAIVRECYALIGDQRHVNHSLGAAGI